MTVVPRWEWRVVGDDFGPGEAQLASHAPERVEESDELYVLSPNSDASAKVRAGEMDVKERLAVNEAGLEQWRPILKEPFPLPAAQVRRLFEALELPAPPDRGAYALDDLIDALGDAGARVIPVHKRRTRYMVDGCMAEISELTSEASMTRTIAIEATDPARVSRLVEELGFADREVVCMARGLKALVGWP